MNISSIVIASVANFFLGALWYSPGMFGSVWLKHAYPDKKPEGGTALYVLSLIGHSIAVTLISYTFSTLLVVKSLEEAIRVALLLSGIVCSVAMPHAAFGGKTLTWYLIDQGYDVALLVLASVILVWLG